jgi:hypothetical protein
MIIAKKPLKDPALTLASKEARMNRMTLGGSL